MAANLTVKEFCERYAISRTTFYRQRAAGHLRVMKIGSATRIRFEDAEAWAEQMLETVANDRGAK
jgi:excisionase family DNA binding protein